MQIAVVGARYVGLVTGTGFAEFGHAVTCVDVDHALVATLARGDTPIASYLRAVLQEAQP